MRGFFGFHYKGVEQPEAKKCDCEILTVFRESQVEVEPRVEGQWQDQKDKDHRDNAGHSEEAPCPHEEAEDPTSELGRPCSHEHDGEA
jgi:hypothetical protein